MQKFFIAELVATNIYIIIKDVLIMKNENKLLTRDYISIGVFSLIYFVIAFVIGGIAQLTPVTFPFMFWMMSVFFVIFGFIADFICRTGNFKSFRRNLIAYCVFALSPMGAYIPMVLMPAQFDEFMRRKGDVSSFEGIINSIRVNWWVIPLMILGTIICAVIGGLIGRKLLKKHFEKVGII